MVRSPAACTFYEKLLLNDDFPEGTLKFCGVRFLFLQFSIPAVLALEQLAAAFAQFLLPGGHLAGMYFVAGGDLVNTAPFFNRFQGHLEFELWRVASVFTLLAFSGMVETSQTS